MSISRHLPFGSNRAHFSGSLSDYAHSQDAAREAQVMFSITCEQSANGQLIAVHQSKLKEPSPMSIREDQPTVHWNWIAILSYTASLAVSLAIWTGLFQAVAHWVK